jgi:hypothetical protein
MLISFDFLQLGLHRQLHHRCAIKAADQAVVHAHRTITLRVAAAAITVAACASATVADRARAGRMVTPLQQ